MPSELPAVTALAAVRIPPHRPLCALALSAEEDRAVAVVNRLAGEQAYSRAAKEAKRFVMDSQPAAGGVTVPPRRRRVA